MAAAAAGVAGGAGWAHGMAGGGTRVCTGWCGGVGRNCPLVAAHGRWWPQLAGRWARKGVTGRQDGPGQSCSEYFSGIFPTLY